ncbi:hypothetical protein TTHERM_00250920 (macronuclear) [Tetrahymena thermophila SB210]|uniref:Uncharacterized protein n=1 Tax=Tetrahymena thermophila (strain SB210) TaxID=312017 RepID=Q23QU1_TETTS|nr:hypothetical protein TTHERM_00250920 [Tetrahymena thermophila SB210]EAR98797.1 hypothetical protein TTHERM_00250920 [Tetrahymena thermophila SB210]|eukprot:XP_001019042.1 hypothetical protein TTHERM_00250920 [Tetrahymena thermophila SB210]
MKSYSQNNINIAMNSQINNASQLNSKGKAINMIQKPLRTECSPKNYSNNSFTLNQTQPFQLNAKRNSIEPTSISHRLVQNSKRTTHNNYNQNQNSSKEKENINIIAQFSSVPSQNRTSQLQQNSKGSQIQIQNAQNQILNNSGQKLYSSRVTTHQFEQKLIQQQQLNNSQVQQLNIQPLDFLDMSKGDLKLSQVISPTSLSRLNSSTSSSSKEKIQCQKSLSKINCKNHTTVQAHYYVIENRVVSYFCTQCSVNLVKKGLKLHEILNSQQSQKKPLQQVNINNIQQNSFNPTSTPMKLSLGQHKMINLNFNQVNNQKSNQQRNISNVTNSPSSQLVTPSSTLLTPRQQTSTASVSIFEPFSSTQEVNNHHLNSQQQTPTLNALNQNDEDFEESFDKILVKNKIKDLQGDKLKVKEYLEDLMNKLDNVRVLSQQKLDKIENKKLQLHEFYECQKQIILEKMLELITMIEQEKQVSLQNIEQQKGNGMLELNGIEQNLKQQMKDMKNIRCDIKDNISNIFNNLDLKPFKVIYNKYNDKLEQFQESINKVDMSYLSYQILKPSSISTYISLLTNKQNNPFQLETKSEILNFNLTQHLQSIFPQNLQTTNKKERQSFVNNDEKLNEDIKQRQHTPQSKQEQTYGDITHEDTPRNNDKTIQSNKEQNNRQNTRENQVYVSFNNKNIFQNDLANHIETLNDEQNQEPIPMVSLNLSSNKQSSDDDIQGFAKPSEQTKLKIQKLLKEESKDNEKGIFIIKEEEANNNNSLSNQICSSSHQRNSNQFNSVSSNQYNSNQFGSNQMIDSQIQNFGSIKQDSTQLPSINAHLVNSQNEYGLINNISKESIDIINLDTYKQSTLLKQTSPSRNSQNSQNGVSKGRSTCKSPNSLKYLELIDKINTNQLNTNIFYQTLIRDNQITSSSQDNAPSSTNTFATQLQKMQINNNNSNYLDPNKSLTQQNKTISDLNNSLNIQQSQVIFNDPIQKQSNSIVEIGSISPISVLATPNSNYYISSAVNTTQSKRLSSPTIARTITLPGAQQNHNYQKKLF